MCVRCSISPRKPTGSTTLTACARGTGCITWMISTIPMVPSGGDMHWEDRPVAMAPAEEKGEIHCFSGG